MKNPRVLAVLGALIIAAGVGFYYVQNVSHVNGRDVEGAIGAVEKHRATQITQADVILGDEQFRREEEALYAAFLNDAAALEARSAELGIFARGIGARAQDVAGIRADLASLDNNLESRFADVAGSSADLVDFLMKQERLAAFADELGLMQRSLLARDRLEAKQLATFEQQLSRMAADVAAREDDVATLEAMSRNVQGIVSRIDNRNADLAKIRADLEAMSADFAMQRALEAKMMESRIRCVEARVHELQLVMHARAQIGALNKLERFTDDALSARHEDLLAVSRDMVGLAAALEARAMENIAVRYRTLNQDAAQLAEIRVQLAALSKGVDARADAVDARALQQSVESFSKAVDARHNLVAARVNDSMQAELGAISAHFESHAQLEARMQQALAAEQEGIEARARLQELGFVADLAAIRAQLDSIARDVETNAFVKAEARSQLAVKAQELQARAKEL